MPEEQIVDTREKKNDADILLAEAKERFRHTSSAEENNRTKALDDLQHLNGNQWPGDVIAERTRDTRPILTVNKLPAFVDQVIGDSRLNRLAIKVRPAGSGATKDIAETFNGLIRNIETLSNAEIVYQAGLQDAVNGGFGYWKIVADYIDDDVFDQEIRLKKIKNPFSVYFDPMYQEPDGRDARYVFETELMPRDEFKIRYPKAKEPSNWQSAKITEGHELYDWIFEHTVRIAKYWVKRPQEKTILLLSDGTVVEESKWVEIIDELEQIGQPVPEVVKDRVVKSHKVVSYLIDGTQIIEGPTDWAGKFIPYIPVWGKELIIDGKRYLRGLVRFSKEVQRLYNWERTAGIEEAAMMSKAPWIGTKEQFENHTEWDTASQKPYPYLTYNHQAGIPPPQRDVVSKTPIDKVQQALIAADEMKDTMSLQDASLGKRSNETSGVAIQARQREGDVANFAYHDNLRRAVAYTADQLVDLIPKIYDTLREQVVINNEDKEETITLNQKEGVDDDGNPVIVNDLSVGKYMVNVEAGPSFTTRRVEASENMLAFVKAMPNAGAVVMDLIAEVQDWPKAAEFAARLKKVMGIPEEGEEQQPDPLEQAQLAKTHIENERLSAQVKETFAKIEKLEAETKQITRETQGVPDKDVDAIAQAALAGAGIARKEGGEQG